MQVAAFGPVQAMGCEPHLEDEVPGLGITGRLLALAGQPYVLPGLDALGDLHVERALAQPGPAVLAELRQAQREGACATFERGFQVDHHARMVILALLAPAMGLATAEARAAEQGFEELAGVAFE